MSPKGIQVVDRIMKPLSLTQRSELNVANVQVATEQL